MRVNLTKKEIVSSIYMQLGFSKKVSETLLDDILDLLVEKLVINKKVKISKFGTFKVKNKKSRVGRNPKTKEEKKISERNVLLFKASKELKNYINENEK